MPHEIRLDVCGLEPPEPLERVLEALATLRADQCLCMVIDREPRPLYAILDRNGYAYAATLTPEFLYEIRIRHRQ